MKFKVTLLIAIQVMRAFISFGQDDKEIKCNDKFDFDLGFITDSLASETEPLFFMKYFLKKEELNFNFESTFEFYLFKMSNGEYIAYSHLPTGYPDSYGITVEYGLKKNINRKYKFNRIRQLGKLKTNSGVYLGMTMEAFIKLKEISINDFEVDKNYSTYVQTCGYKTHLGNMEEIKFYSNQNKFTFLNNKLVCINLGNYTYDDINNLHEKYIVFDK